MHNAPALHRPRSHRLLALGDGAVALAFLVVSAIDVTAAGSAVDVLAAVACAVSGGAVGLRGRRPGTAALLSLAGLVGCAAPGGGPGILIAPYAVVLCFYRLGRQAPAVRVRADHAAVHLVALVSVAVSLAESGKSGPVQVLGGWLLFCGGPYLLGSSVSRHVELARQLAANLAALSNATELGSRRAMGQERSEVARELHDVVAHCVSVMVIHAGGAGLIAETDPAACRSALQVVASCGREALADLRLGIGVLGRVGADAVLPQQTVPSLDVLVERTRGAGIPTTVSVIGVPVELAPELGLVVYRVVQEALTNVVRHSVSATVRLEVRYDADGVRLSIADSGREAGQQHEPEPAGGSGHGLIGMRERVIGRGGELVAGPLHDGGFEVRAYLPYTGAVLAAPVAAVVEAEPPKRVHRGVPRLDLLMAAGWLVVLEAEALTSAHRHGPLVLNVAAVGGMALAGVARRRAPLLFLLLVNGLALTLVQGLTSREYATITGVYGVLVPAYALGAWGRGRRSLAGLAAWAVGATAVGLAERASAGGLVGPVLAACAAWLLGWVIRRQRELIRRIDETSTWLAAEKQEWERLAAAAERAGIVRQLQPAVADALTAMVARADAAYELLAVDAAAAVADIAMLEETGRATLVQLRTILGVLRRPDADLEPLPGLDQIRRLVQRTREAGQPVDLVIHGAPGCGAPGVDLITFRIVEAILLPSHPPAPELGLALRFADGNVELEVTGSGVASGDWPSPVVREKVALCEGDIHCSSVGSRVVMRIRLPRTTVAALA